MKRWNCTIGLALTVCLLNLAHAGKPDKSKPGDETGPTYNLVTLADEADGVIYDSTWGSDVNASNNVAGRVHLTGIGSFAACWKSDGSLNLLPGVASQAYGLNDNNEVVGVGRQDTVGPVYWPSLDADPIALPRLDGYQGARPMKISNSGVICGEVFSTINGTRVSRAIVWKVLANGDIAGPFELPMLNDSDKESVAVAVNEELDGISLVVGEAYSSEIGYSAIAWAITFVIDPESDELILQAMPTPLNVGNHARASAVNNSYEVVGKAISGAPMYWSETNSHTLNGLAPEKPLGWALGINNHGTIVGQSWHYEYKGKQVSWEGQIAAVWPTPESDPILLVPINGSVWGGNVNNEARAINDAGVILVNYGSRASLAFPQ